MSITCWRRRRRDAPLTPATSVRPSRSPRRGHFRRAVQRGQQLLPEDEQPAGEGGPAGRQSHPAGLHRGGRWVTRATLALTLLREDDSLNLLGFTSSLHGASPPLPPLSLSSLLFCISLSSSFPSFGDCAALSCLSSPPCLILQRHSAAANVSAADWDGEKEAQPSSRRDVRASLKTRERCIRS